MLKKTDIYLYILCFLPMIGFSQSMVENAFEYPKRIPLEEWREISEDNIPIQNEAALHRFFEQLSDLYFLETGKVRITHIGDSHIQAGFFPSKTRKDLQQVFGNAGLGFTFPHRLAKSNGILELRYTSSIPWESKRNIHATENDFVGLSGFSLQTTQRDFAIHLEIMEEAYAFDFLRVFSANSSPMFHLAQANRKVEMKNYTIENKIHKIKSGEALSIIARNYGVSVAQIKKANNLRSDAIRAGASLRIPVKTNTPQPIDRTVFELLSSIEENTGFVYKLLEPSRSIWLLPNEKMSSFALNGVVLERDHAGLIYDGIGVNGARFADYNKTKLFFEQLQVLQPNLLVISLGTNEAFDRLEKEKYIEELERFTANLREVLPEVPLLFTTPPPSLVRKQSPNIFAETYAKEILNIAEKHAVAVWDLHQVLGGNTKVRSNFSNGILAKDHIHYTKKGYEYTGSLLSEALLQAFFNYSINSSN